MNTLSNARTLAMKQAQRLCTIEKQYLMYLKVLAHKVANPRIKAAVLACIPITRQKLQQLQQLLATKAVSSETDNTVGINGIMSEGFQQLEQEDRPALLDAIILHTIIISAHYKLGNYRILLRYFQVLDWEYEMFVVQAMLEREEKRLRTFMKLLQMDTAPAKDRRITIKTTSLDTITHT